MMGFLKGKKALITGVAGTRSLAYGIAQAMHAQGAELAFTYQNERLKERVAKVAEEFGSSIVLPCDVSSDMDIEDLFAKLSESWSQLDILVHSIAYAPSDQLEGDYLDHVNRSGFQTAHEISSYSFAALAKSAKPMLSETAALITMTYIGSEKVMSNYNTMGIAKASLEANVRYLANSLGPKGIRVNAISAGPIRTLAAAGIKDFKKLLNFNASVTPLRHNTTIEEVGNTAAFLCSELASGITGEIVHVDSGFHCVTPMIIEEDK